MDINSKICDALCVYAYAYTFQQRATRPTVHSFTNEAIAPAPLQAFRVSPLRNRAFVSKLRACPTVTLPAPQLPAATGILRPMTAWIIVDGLERLAPDRYVRAISDMKFPTFRRRCT
jgi:hypothetical protein